MSLLDDVRAVCEKLVANCWPQILSQICDLDITLYAKPNFAYELNRPLKKVVRTVKGMADFWSGDPQNIRAIEPGMPARSLLFHVLASPAVNPPAKATVPTPEDLDVIENYIYGVIPPSIEDLRQRVGDAPMALVVFTSEYRSSAETVHQRQADMCYSRVGVSRIGTAAVRYSVKARGYTSIGSDPKAVHAIPTRYTAYIAARFKGDFQNFGPMRPRKGTAPDPRALDTAGFQIASDDTRFFWVPLHKVFSGNECIRDMNLHLTFRHYHQNEKLRRLFLNLETNGLISKNRAGQYCGEVLKDFPFVIPQHDLISVSSVPGSSIQIIPKPHPLAEEARLKGRRVVFEVPAGGAVGGGAFRIPSRPGRGRTAPEYIYVRQEVDAQGHLKNLNSLHKVVQKVNRGGYLAQLYIDYSGDGWVSAHCEELALTIPRSLAAYSLLAPPDLYPLVKQQSLYDWWLQSVPPTVSDTLFPDFEQPIPTEPLSDARLTANITYRQPITPMSSVPIFDSDDDTYTAIVARMGSGQAQQNPVDFLDDDRVSSLGDGASGLFAPGWDVSVDQHDDDKRPDGVLHLAAYGGAIPFLEDERLCAAQSAFWPAVAPDMSRLYEPGIYSSVTPIPDSRLGWDGLARPRILRRQTPHQPGIVRFYSLSHTDYVQRASSQGFDFKSIGSVQVNEYERWTLLMALVYETINATTTQEKARWALVRFDSVNRSDSELIAAENKFHIKLHDPYLFFLIKPFCITPAKDPLYVLASFDRYVLAFATPSYVLYYDNQSGEWEDRVF